MSYCSSICFDGIRHAAPIIYGDSRRSLEVRVVCVAMNVSLEDIFSSKCTQVTAMYNQSCAIMAEFIPVWMRPVSHTFVGFNCENSSISADMSDLCA